MRLGAHVSSAGGVFNVFANGAAVDSETVLIFTKSNRQWRAKPLTEKDIEKYQAEQSVHENIFPVAVHASYLINIASPKPELWEKSFQALKVELLRADMLGIPTLTFHPGSHVGSGEEAGLTQIARAVTRLLEETPDCQTVLCLETMSGQGTNLGYKFEHLAFVLNEVDSDRVGVCLDTCHIFSAGYDIRSAEAYAGTMQTFDDIVGLNHIRCFHFNDSKFELGTRKDRHAHIGEGYIGAEGFAHFINDPRWQGYGAHIETPKIETDSAGNKIEMDVVNLKFLRSLRHN